MVVDYAEWKDAMDAGIALGKQYGLTDDRIVRGGDRRAVIASTTADVPLIKAALGL